MIENNAEKMSRGRRRKAAESVVHAVDPSDLCIESPERRDEVSGALKRFKRNRLVDEELDSYRFRLILARVRNGLTQAEASQCLAEHGMAVDVAAIEGGTAQPGSKSGNTTIMKHTDFLLAVCQTYGVSSDWLIGIAPTMEPDSRLATQFAAFGRFESFICGVLNEFVRAAADATQACQFNPAEIAAMGDAVADLVARYEKLAVHPAFEDMPGAPLHAAVDRLKAVLPRIWVVHGRYVELQKVISNLGDHRALPPALRAAAREWADWRARPGHSYDADASLE